MRNRQGRRMALLLAALLINLGLSNPSTALDLAGTAWEAAAAPHGHDPYLLYAIALMESGRARDGGLGPWPWTLRVPNQGGRFYDGREQALTALQSHAGAAVDIGLMQINLLWHGHRVARPEVLLEPRRNLEIAAEILAEALASAPDDLELGVGRYHSSHEARARDYGRTVLAIHDQLLGLRRGAGP